MTLWCGQDMKIPNPDGLESEKIVMENLVQGEHARRLLFQAVSCNTIGTHTDAQATELAMLKLVTRCDCDYQHQRQQYLSKDMLRFAFTSQRKRMSTVLEFDADDEEQLEHGYAKRLHTKGASEQILETCTHYLNDEGVKTVLSDDVKAEIANTIVNYAK